VKFFLLLLFFPSLAFAGSLNIATASNFYSTLQKISAKYQKIHPEVQIKISSSATAGLYSQIINGAPFDLFFSSDEKHIDLLIAKNIAHREPSFIYARGILCLLSSDEKLQKINEQTLRNDSFKFLAIAKPESAPYGFAAKEVLVKLGLWDRVNKKLVYAFDVGSVMNFVATKNVDFGFIALSQAVSWQEKNRKNLQNQMWIVPQNLYNPINQKVAMLKGSKENLALAFLNFVQSAEIKKLIIDSGYARDPANLQDFGEKI
jgi:molybdate transport system substrate-binding protein